MNLPTSSRGESTSHLSPDFYRKKHTWNTHALLSRIPRTEFAIRNRGEHSDAPADSDSCMMLRVTQIADQGELVPIEFCLLKYATLSRRLMNLGQ
jgi:hypothetical protein